MYLAICENQREDLDTVCSLPDTWKAECLSSAELPAFRGKTLSVSCAQRKEADGQLLDYYLKGEC